MYKISFSLKGNKWDQENLTNAWLTERMAAERFRPTRRMNERSRLRDRNMTCCWQSADAPRVSPHSRSHHRRRKWREKEEKKRRRFFKVIRAAAVAALTAVLSGSTLSSDSRPTCMRERHHERKQRELKTTHSHTHRHTSALTDRSFSSWGLFFFLFFYNSATDDQVKLWGDDGRRRCRRVLECVCVRTV